MNDPLTSSLGKLRLANIAVSVADVDTPGVPLLYVNEAFTELTGYSFQDVIGQNCRFLQGEETDPNSPKQLSEAIKDFRMIGVCLVNYRKSGEPFHNYLIMSPIVSMTGRRLIVGSQYDFSNAVIGLQIEQHIQRVAGVIDRLRPELSTAASMAFDSLRMTAMSAANLVDARLGTEDVLQEADASATQS